MIQRIKEFLFHNQTIRQTVAKNTFWLTVSNFGGRLFRSIIIIYAARVLGTGPWGVFSYALSLVAFVTVFSDIGIGNILVREMAKGRDNIDYQRSVLSTAFYLKMTLLAIGILLILFVAPHITKIPEVKIILPIVVFVYVFDTIREFGFSLIRALEKMEWEAFLYLLTNVAIVACGFVFLSASKTVTSMTYAYALGAGIGSFATIIALRNKLKGALSYFSVNVMSSVLKSAWPIAIAAGLGMLMLNADVLIIGWMRAADDVGLYSAAQRIIQLLYILPTILSTSLLPAFSRFAKKDNVRFKAVLEIILHFAYLLAIPIATGGALLSREIITFIFGSSYAGASLSFSILALTLLIDFPVVIFSNVVFAFDQQKKLIIYASIGGILNIIFDLLFIPLYGIAGSAFATLAAQFISNVYLRRVVKQSIDFHVFGRLKRVFVATALMSAACIILNMTGAHILIVVGTGIIIYTTTLLMLKEPIIKEIRSILQPAPSENAP
ncbi:MAG: flippase, partial [bacterium]|nr:flippase [bacterium]